MSAIANIAVNDGQGTPVTHTFIPVAVLPVPYWRENQVGLSIIGQPWMKLDVKQDSGSGLSKVRFTLDLPALETVTGQNSAGYTASPKVGYDNKVIVDFLLPTRGTSAQRKDLRVLLQNALSNAIVIDAIENLNPPY